MLQNAYLLAKIGADTADNEQNFAKNWQLPYGSTTRSGRGRRASRRLGPAAPRRRCAPESLQAPGAREL